MNPARRDAWRVHVLCAALLVVFPAAGAAWSQIVQPMGGRALDASNQIGAGGYNSPVQTFRPNAATIRRWPIP